MATDINPGVKAIDALGTAATCLEKAIQYMAEELHDAAKAGEHSFVQLIAEDITDTSRLAQLVLENRNRAKKREA